MTRHGKTIQSKPGVELRELLSVDGSGNTQLAGYVLVTDSGRVVGTYDNLPDALAAFDDWDDDSTPPPPGGTPSPSPGM